MLFLRLCLFTATAGWLALPAAAQSELARRAASEIRAAGPPQSPAVLSAASSPSRTRVSLADAPSTPADLEALVTGAERLSVAPPPPAAARDPRRLAAPSQQAPVAMPDAKPKLLDIDWSNLPVDPVTTVAALAMVIGLFLLTLTALKRAAPKSQRVLPGEVAAVLGRVPLGGKQMAHLLKVGSKLVLVHVTSDEVKTLTEVTDPAEVTRLLGLCEQVGDHSASTAFRDVFDKLTGDPAPRGFLEEPTTLIDRQRLADAYSNTPGGQTFG